MARLATVGFESQIFNSSATLHGESDVAIIDVAATGTVTVDTSNPRSGAACASQAGGGANFTDITCGANAAGRAQFLRAYFRFSDATPSAQMQILRFHNGTAAAASIRLNTDGTLTLHDNSTQIGSASSALSDNTWYCVEMKVIVPAAGSGTLEGRLGGTVFATSTSASVGTTVTSTRLQAGCCTAAGSGTILVDDIAVNDDTGASQTGYPGEGKIILLKPAAHSAIGTWVGPQTTGDDTTNLQDNVDNTPPLGVAHSDVDANAGFYVFNITNSANQDFDIACAAYDTQLAASDGITLTQALARMSVNSTTGTNTGAVQGVSNPAMTIRTGFNLEASAIAGTEPTGWKSYRSSVAYAPSVTRSTQPVVRARKIDASTRANMIDLMGVLVEYVQPQTVNAGVASEADSVPAATVSQPQTVSGGVASEADSAPAATVSQPQAPVAAGVASESDTAPAATIIQPQAPVAAGVASEADSVPAATVDQAGGSPQTVNAGVASEADSAVAATVLQNQLVAAGVATEADSVPAASVVRPTPNTSPNLDGNYDQAGTGGNVTELQRGGVILVGARGGNFDESATGGNVDESSRGGVHDETSTGGVVH